MKKELHKKRVKTSDSVYLYVFGGTNENSCTNPGCSGSGSGGNARPMGGNTVCTN